MARAERLNLHAFFFTYAIVIAYAKGSAPINRQFVTKHEWYMK